MRQTVRVRDTNTYVDKEHVFSHLAFVRNEGLQVVEPNTCKERLDVRSNFSCFRWLECVRIEGFMLSILY